MWRNEEMKSMKKMMMCLVILAMVVAASAPNGHAAIIPFSTDFESDTIGNEPAGFALLKDTGFAGNSLNVIAAESAFVDGPYSAETGGPGSQALQWLDTNGSDSNPDIVVFDLATGTTDDLVMRFDFVNISGNNLRFQVFDDTGTRAIRLDLDNGGTIKNNGTGDILEFTGSGLNRWHSLEITTDLANNTYDLVMKRQERAEVLTFLDLPFNNTVSNFGSWQFNDLAGASSVNEYYLDNISVDAVPEPASLALLSLGGLLLRRKK
jgi:hypothetical protein